MTDYDLIAGRYKDSKRLPFRDHVERYTLLGILGDVKGTRILDMACGDGFYTRLLKKAGAKTVTGVDISAKMIDLAEENERNQPLGCTYIRADASTFVPAEPVDILVAAYLLNYAKTREELVRLCRACRRCLLPGGRFLGVNDSPFIQPTEPEDYIKYGFYRTWEKTLPDEGDPILYTFPAADGTNFSFTNYYHSAGTYEAAFLEAGFRDFRWVRVSLDPSQRGDPFWDAYMQNSPIVGFSALL